MEPAESPDHLSSCPNKPGPGPDQALEKARPLMSSAGRLQPPPAPWLRPLGTGLDHTVYAGPRPGRCQAAEGLVQTCPLTVKSSHRAERALGGGATLRGPGGARLDGAVQAAQQAVLSQPSDDRWSWKCSRRGEAAERAALFLSWESVTVDTLKVLPPCQSQERQRSSHRTISILRITLVDSS
ncbi:hypothetical protein NQZ68_013006 [Dissostichus eleginoides]|nr:hypothetical protein NQZ68_013006 [Dissostichus eleginoides]